MKWLQALLFSTIHSFVLVLLRNTNNSILARSIKVLSIAIQH